MPFRVARRQTGTAGHGPGSVILAAGRSSRMGYPKSELVLPNGETALQRILRYHFECGLRVRLVVADNWRGQLPPIPEACVLINRQQQKGPLFSLQLALQTLPSVSAILVQAVDHPLVSRRTLQRLLSRHRRTQARILVPEYQGRRGHPVLFPARFFRELREAPLEIGARAVVRSRPQAVMRVPVEDPGIHANLNSPAQLQRCRWIDCRETRPRPGQYLGMDGSI